jgi:hypothetical protein
MSISTKESAIKSLFISFSTSAIAPEHIRIYFMSKTTAKLFIACTMTVLTLGSNCSIADSPKSRAEYVFLGPAILNSCRFVDLVSLKDESLGVNEDQNNFARTRVWIVQNIWRSMNPVPNITTKADYSLVFYSKPIPFTDGKTNITSLILLRIPLTRETLGPHFKEKIGELKSVMRDASTVPAHQTQSPDS